ncbi:MAG: SDR family oxidoreductase [Acidimicrobiaceae bacterium]|nr:SDR family oxidoreductase [Acidimicrobiaceae bacterium]MXZ66532.1 SDR family oxidoreductase [Acidimicrobiaceae bacterium]MYF34100.1 SDR family oxidoreductase [Acidimicrobiaceae bacterium]MYG79280.1 SDR family oxidoreductase [Acidimicrobiaceae bacterium]MYJ30361.1 SDR family oxidoreductase [Acidimicrobiaceae bacterium]
MVPSRAATEGCAVFSLTGKVTVVTGAASGIGLATARRFAEAGATVVLSDIVDGSAFAAEMDAEFVAVDVSEEDSVAALVASVVEAHGRLDVMVNNAGVLLTSKGIDADSTEDVRRMMDVNLFGVLYGMRHASRAMERGGSIVNTASMAGIVGFPGLSTYGASKWGVVGLTRYGAIEFGPLGIRVNCVCPTGVATPLAGDTQDHWAARSQALAHQHTNRLATADEVAAAIHYLASDEAAMVNGHALNIDGGLGAGMSIEMIEAAIGESIRDGSSIIE